MKGTSYKLYNHNWSGNVSLMLSHWGFQLIGQYVRAQHDLCGEKSVGVKIYPSFSYHTIGGIGNLVLA